MVSHSARFYLCKVGHVLFTQPHDRMLVFNRGFLQKILPEKMKALPYSNAFLYSLLESRIESSLPSGTVNCTGMRIYLKLMLVSKG